MLPLDLQADIARVAGIPAVPTILDVICRTTGMGFAAVARVTPARWTACSVLDNIAFGLAPGGELPIESTICHEIRQSGDLVVIDHVAGSPLWCGHHTPARYGFQSYISVPIVLADGSFFGTLCAIDPNPARLDTPETIGMFRLFAQLIAHHLDAAAQVAASEATLLTERETARLREQFIAVLGHDLRNPLGAIGAAADILRLTPLSDKAARMAVLIQNSAARMAGLIEDVLDFARARLGSGLTIAREPHAQMEPVLRQVIAELAARWPSRAIQADLRIDRDLVCDPRRIGQMASNLLANAITHGAADQPVRVQAETTRDAFVLAVVNAGVPIPPHVQARLFRPFVRGEVRESQQGLGLGLYIASEIANAHGGMLTLSSTQEETRFTFTMPLDL